MGNIKNKQDGGIQDRIQKQEHKTENNGAKRHPTLSQKQNATQQV